MTTPTIGIACHSFRTDGGMGRYVQLLAEGLLNLGIHPTVITKKKVHLGSPWNAALTFKKKY